MNKRELIHKSLESIRLDLKSYCRCKKKQGFEHTAELMFNVALEKIDMLLFIGLIEKRHANCLKTIVYQSAGYNTIKL